MPERSRNGATKGETLTIRMPPRLHYALTLIARDRHSSLSSVVCHLIELNLPNDFEKLWHPLEVERLKRLRKEKRHLLSYEEELKILGE